MAPGHPTNPDYGVALCVALAAEQETFANDQRVMCDARQLANHLRRWSRSQYRSVEPSVTLESNLARCARHSITGQCPMPAHDMMNADFAQ
jgi:hypothetical protein